MDAYLELSDVPLSAGGYVSLGHLALLVDDPLDLRLELTLQDVDRRVAGLSRLVDGGQTGGLLLSPSLTSCAVNLGVVSRHLAASQD